MKNMRYVGLLLVSLTIPAAVFAQGLLPGKGLGFAQIAFGGGFETVVNVTNRGTDTYTGSLFLNPTDPTKPFPALVNDRAASGAVNVTLNAGATASYRITSGNASAGVSTGFALILTSTPEKDGMIEGNLTYYFRAADGTILDSTGVAPSQSILQATIPFDDFQSVALALANTTNAAETITMTVFDDKNTQVGTMNLGLGSGQQVPKFLSQFFAGVSLTKGRVEIQSSQPFIGTALTYVGGQGSSLPLSTSLKMLEAKLVVSGVTIGIAHVYAAINGTYATFYSADLANGVPQPGIGPDVGLVKNGTLEIISREGSSEILDIIVPNFNPQAKIQNGTIVLYSLNPPSVEGQGTITLTALN